MNLATLDNVYVISDTHFYHENIIRYCNRPFKNYEEMNEFMLSKFDKLPEGSIIIHLGDVCMSRYTSREQLEFVVNRMKENNKTLILILGNHDKEIRFKKREQTLKDYYKEVGFSEVYSEHERLEGYNVSFTHKPSELTEVFNIHGHIHNGIMIEDFYSSDTHFNVSAENLNYEPILLKTILGNNPLTKIIK